MLHSAEGWWIAEAGSPPPFFPLATIEPADVAIFWGGYTGLW